MIAVAVLSLLFGFLVGCVYEGCRRGGTVDLNLENARLRAVTVCGEATATARLDVESDLDGCKPTPTTKEPARPC